MSYRERVRSALLTTITAAVLASCPGASDYRTRLPNDYALVRVYSGASGIVDPKGVFVVGPSSFGILLAVVDDIVVGNLDTEERAFHVPEVPDRFFVINTHIREVRAELSETEYREALAEIGMDPPPALIRPTKLTRFIQ